MESLAEAAEAAFRTFQDWLASIERATSFWQDRRFLFGLIGQTNKANLRTLRSKREDIVSRFERLVKGVKKQDRQLDLMMAGLNRMELIRWQLGGGMPSWREGNS